MFFIRNESKLSVITENSENNVADFVHDSAESDHFNFGFAFEEIILPEGWIMWNTFSGDANANDSDSENGASCDGRTTFGHFDISARKIAGLLDGGVNAEIGEKLFRGFENGKVADFANNGNSR